MARETDIKRDAGFCSFAVGARGVYRGEVCFFVIYSEPADLTEMQICIFQS